MMWFRSSLLVALVCALALASPVPDAVTPIATDVTTPATQTVSGLTSPATPTASVAVSGSASGSVSVGSNGQVTADLWVTLQADPELTDFCELIRSLNLEHLFKNHNVQRTVFAPINLALQALRAKFALDRALLRELVKNAVIAGNWTKDELSQIATQLAQAQQNINNAATAVQNTANNAVNNLQNTVNQVAANAANQVQTAANNAQQAAGQAAGQVGQAVTTVGQQIQQTIAGIPTAIQSLLATINQKLQQLDQTIQNAFTTLTGKLAQAHAYTNDLVVQGGKVVQANIPATNGMIHKVNDVQAPAVGTIADKLASAGSPVTQLLNKLKNTLPDIYNKITDPDCKSTVILPNASTLTSILALTGDALKAKLASLVLPGQLSFEDLKQMTSVPLYNGLPVQVSHQSNTAVTVGDFTLSTGANQVFSNGVIIPQAA